MVQTTPGVVLGIVVAGALAAGVCAPWIVWRRRRSWWWLVVATGLVMAGFGLQVATATTSLRGGETSSHDVWLLIAIFVTGSWLMGLVVGGIVTANWAVLRGRDAPGPDL